MKFFWKLDPRLLGELKKQRRSILLGLGCVAVTSLLTTANIALIDRAVDAIANASPIPSGWSKPSGLQLDQLKGDALDKVANELKVPKEQLQGAIQRASGNQKLETPDESKLRRKDSMDTLGWISLIIVGVYGLKYFFTRGQSFYLTRAAAQLATELRMAMFAKLQRLPISYFNQARTGAIQSVLTNDVNVYQNAVMIIRDSIDGPIKALAAFATIIAIQPQLAAVVAMTVPALWFVIQRNGRKMRAAQRQVQEDLSEVNAVTQESLLGARVIKSFGAEERVQNTYKSFVSQALQSQLRAARRVAALRPMVELIGAVGLAVILYACGWLAFGGNLKLSHIAALMYALDVINQGFRALGYVNNTYNQVQAASQRIYEHVLDVPEEHEETTGTVKLASTRGQLSFEHVSFAYPDGTPALKDVSFTLDPGTSLALVGPSGAGKSTIADLTLRFYDPDSGVIRLDGVDIRELDLKWYREQIGVVPQQNFLFAGPILDNLKLGAPDATMIDIQDAARAAHADVFIDALPEGYATLLGERGVGLSGGEMQRVAIARAIVRKPPLLLLDEATSALDAHSEKAVQEALDTIMKQRTTLFIAHRLTTAARADRIMVMRKGEVIEIGTHRDLLATGGAYASMVTAFQSGVIDESIG